jgi:pimeloyl-ACP methyl ester carboxylesterase
MSFLTQARTQLGALVLAGGLVSGATVAAASADSVAYGSATSPTIVLVPGPSSDFTNVDGIAGRLQHAGFTVLTSPKATRDAATQAANVAGFLATVQGSIVLVGTSYGDGTVAQVAANDPQVKAVVYLSSFVAGKVDNSSALTCSFDGNAGSSLNLPFVGSIGAGAPSVCSTRSKSQEALQVAEADGVAEVAAAVARVSLNQ